MIFEQYYLECLSHASYLIGDRTTGRAVVVDPQRDVSAYLEDANRHGLTIEMVIETHFHADFLSGHLELAEATGAHIVYSSVAETEFGSVGMADGERLALGEVVLEFRHTPGHTPESMSIVVFENADQTEPFGVLTGDTLFIGDVGRPDLLASIGHTRDELADALYDSLHDKIMTLPDQTRVFPAHGAGSACGKNLSTELSSTIGEQKATNYALRAPDKATFMALVTEGQAPAPGYFAYDAILNRKNRDLLDEDEMPAALTFDQLQSAMAAGAVLVDARSAEDFALGHLRGAINIGLAGRYAEYGGSVLPHDADIVLMTDPGQELEGKNRLARIGFDRVIGYLADPEEAMVTHAQEVQTASRLTAAAFDERIASIADLQVVDVRKPTEVADGAVAHAVNIPVGDLPGRLDELDPQRPTVVYCAGGYRSSAAASLLRREGFADVSDILGGYGAWVESHQHA
ncbi:rhodanese-like domain-containing protein [Mycolicibacterium sp. A43C]